MKTEEITRDLTEEDRLDITLVKENRVLHKFALNYRAWMNEEWNEVYRVDNYHNFLHEQKFWISEKPIPITDKQGWPLRMVVKHYLGEIVLNFQKYKKYYQKSKKRRV